MQAWTATGTATTINFLNPPGGTDGHATTGNQNFPVPSGASATANLDNFVAQIAASIEIPAAGTYTFLVNSDEGFTLTLTNAASGGTTPNFLVVTNGDSGNVGTTTISYSQQRMAGDTLGQMTFTAGGVYNISLTYFEHTGSADLELWASPYVKTAYDSTFRLVGDTANGGLPMWRTGHELIDDVTAAEFFLANDATGTVGTANTPVVNFLNTGSSGNFANDASYPGYNQSTVSTNFVSVSTGLIHIPDTGTFPQTWTFGVNSDEGFKLSLMGVSRLESVEL